MLAVSVFQNFKLWKKTRFQEVQIEKATKNLTETNRQLKQKVVTRFEFSKNREEIIDGFDFSFPHKKTILDDDALDPAGLHGIQLYDFQKKREENLTQHIFLSAIKYRSTKDIVPKLSNQDSLYFGYTKHLPFNTKYELKVNGEPQEFKFENKFSQSNNAPIEVEMTQMTISDDGMHIDTSKAFRIINKI